RSMTSPSASKRSAACPPAQPVISGARAGAAVHQVGKCVSFDWTNLKSSFQNCSRKRRMILTTWPISMRSSARCLSRSSGVKRIASGAFSTPIGTVMMALRARRIDVGRVLKPSAAGKRPLSAADGLRTRPASACTVTSPRRAEEIGEGAIAPAANAREYAAHLSPEIVDMFPFAAAHPPVIVGKLVGEERRGVDDAERLFDFAVDEFCAELDGESEIGLMDGVDAAADALARFDDDNVPAGARQIARRGEARGPCPNDDDVYVIRGRSPTRAAFAPRGSSRRCRSASRDRRGLGEDSPPRERPACCVWGGGGSRRSGGCVRTR